MRTVLEYPTSFNGISNNPNWNLDCLVSEIDSVEKNLNVVSKNGRRFVMRVSEDETESEDEEEQEHEQDYQICRVEKRFTCDDSLSLVINDHKTLIEEDIRKQVSVVETETFHEIAMFRSAMARVEKYRETREDVERRLDLLYQRKVAEALDTYLTAVQQRAHEENASREAVMQETIKAEEVAAVKRAQEEKARAEAVMRATIIAEEEAKKKADDDQRKVAKEEARVVNSRVAETSNHPQAAESALTLEKHRLKKLQELEATNQLIRANSDKDFTSFERHVARMIKQICATKDNVIAKTNEIIKIFRDPSCPISISIATFANKMASAKQNPYACSYVIVCVTSQFPQTMEILLAEFHKACVYTVPVTISDQPDWDSDAYYKRMDSVMRLYGALVQTDIHGCIHGIEHGWAWLARFLNKTTAHNKATATALNAFLQTAGFGLHKRYKSQFLKALNVVREHFLAKLRAEKDLSDLQTIIANITAYLDDRMYLCEPQGRNMQTGVLSMNNEHQY